MGTGKEGEERNQLCHPQIGSDDAWRFGQPGEQCTQDKIEPAEARGEREEQPDGEAARRLKEASHEVIGAEEQGQAAEGAHEVINQLDACAGPARDVAERQIIGVDEDTGARLRGIRQGEQPFAAPALAHLGEIRGAVNRIEQDAAKDVRGWRRVSQPIQGINAEQNQRGKNDDAPPFGRADVRSSGEIR